MSFVFLKRNIEFVMWQAKDKLHPCIRVAGMLALLAVSACMSVVDSFSGRTESCEIIATGIPAEGKILRLIDVGTINQDPIVEFVLQVTLPGTPPYEARAKALVSRLDIPSIQPGRVVPLKVDPRSPQRVAIDLWECPKN